MSQKRKVLADAKKRLQEHRQSGAWLNEAVDFNHDVSLPEEHKNVAKMLFDSFNVEGYNRKQKFKDFEILVANLLSVHYRKPIAVYLDRNAWKKSEYSKASYNMIKVIAIMEERGLIKMQKGYHIKNTDESRKTRIWPTSLLLNYFVELPRSVIYDPATFVELHDEHGRRINYRDTKFTLRVKKILRRVKETNEAYAIWYDGYKLNGVLIAIFVQQFNLYGRLHTKGHRHHYQSLSEEERAEITIDNEPVIELDFSALHPRLLYAREKIQYNHDAYSVVHNDPKARSFLKRILLFMLNSKDFVTAEKAANYWLYKNHYERRKLKEIGITRARPFMEAFVEAHKPISHHFCSGKNTGLRTMNLDAKIALDIVDRFARAGKPILAVHDSFVVQATNRDELFRTMDEKYRKHTKGFTCPIK